MPLDCPVISHLENWRDKLSQITSFESAEAKAKHIGLLNQIDTAIKRLTLCDIYDIFPSAWVCVLPSTPNKESNEYRVVSDEETDRSQMWKEVAFEKRGMIRLNAGDLVIKR